MENNDLVIEKFNKIYELTEEQDPVIFSQLCLQRLQDYAPHVVCFQGENLNNGQQNQTYISNLKLRDNLVNLNKIIYLKESPNIILFHDQSETMILEQRIRTRLNDYLSSQEQTELVPYLAQPQARLIMIQLSKCIENFKSQQIQYDCISPRNVVFDEAGVARFSLVGYLLKIDHHHPEYSRANIQQNLTFSMACLFFKLLYGFPPYQSDSKNSKPFETGQYLEQLKSHSQKKLLKIFYYSERNLVLSPSCLQFLKTALSGRMAWSQWVDHEYFSEEFEEGYQKFTAGHQVTDQNKLIKMVSGAKLSDSSTIMAAINYRKDHMYEKLSPKSIPSLDEPSLDQYLQYLKQHRLFCQISKNIRIENDNMKKVGTENERSRIVNIGYFYERQFDTNLDNPCLELIKIIDRQKSRCPVSQREELDSKLKLYGYPYAIAFELMKVRADQPQPIQQKIDGAVDLLLQLSAFNRVSNTSAFLNSAVPSFRSFNDIKPRYRASINELYQYFLNEAMKKYNSKSKSESNRTIGLTYYKLCLKLLEASLIIRKGGADLNLERIEYSSRKQIQDDLAELLGKYFPQRPEIH